jgi:hypothetical protein
LAIVILGGYFLTPKSRGAGVQVKRVSTGVARLWGAGVVTAQDVPFWRTVDR